MRVIITLPGIATESAGPAYSVPALARAVSAAGAEVELHTRAPVPDWEWGVTLHTHRQSSSKLLQRLGWAPAMLKALKRAALDSDIMHVNGVWQLPDIYPMKAVRGTNCKVVYCPRGGLSDVALRGGSRLAKWLMWNFGGQRQALKEAAMFHAASMKEHDEIRSLGLDQPIAVIPNGIDIPRVVHKPFSSQKRKIVFFGRIHPTKAVDNLVAAWGNVADRFGDWSLEIAGPDCGSVSPLKSMIQQRNIPRVSFIGELFGVEKHKFLSSADIYVLPSLTENFGITIAEALACGTPVIASKGCPWERLNEKKCGWWVDIGVDALTAQLEASLSLSPETLKSMGMAGKIWMQSEYSWDTVAKEMMQAYKWLCAGGIKPEFVY